MPVAATPYLITIDHLLSDDERLTWRAAREFCERNVAPGLEQHYENGTFPRELVKQFAEMGFLGAPYEGYGCAGMNPVAYGLTNLELERQDSGIRSFCSVQTSLAMYPIYAYGDETQRQRWLPGMAKGEIVGCFGLTEPNAGSDPGSMRTHARQDGKGGDYVLSGQKLWITNSPMADLCIVWAKTLEHGSDTPVIRGFVVERGSKGLSTPTMHGKLSMRASLTGEIVLDEVRVPKENLLPGVHGLKGPLGCLTQARYGISWGVIGAAMSCYERARSYTIDRVQFDRPIASFQLTQQKLVGMHNEIGKSLLLAYHFGRIKQNGKLSPEQVSILKRENVAMALQTARTARSMLGGNGIMGEFGIMRHLSNLETVYTYEGTHEVHTLAIGRALTGFSAFA
ncbi:MAG: acyl-CoA dehydrogenase family protein [Nannocystaceae bacterium]|nr:acyl-CoA dehydrogenase family protein [Nannocystaceae bacterium]